jgi:hypothetical protein
MTQLDDAAQDCKTAEMLLARALFEESLSGAEQATLDAHLAHCPACRTQNTQLRELHQSLTALLPCAAPETLQETICARVRELPAVPGTPAAIVAHEAGQPLRVVVGATSRSGAWRLASVAALAAAVAVVATLGVLQSLKSGAPSVALSKGSLTDAKGRRADHVVDGAVYTVSAPEAIVPLRKNALVRLPEGARFAVKTQDKNALPAIQLEHGDMYGWNKDTAATMVSSETLHARLNSGDFFVSEDDAALARGVLIVFNGDATISSENDETLQVPGGHVFVSVKGRANAYRELLSMNDVLERLSQEISIDGIEAATLREEYANKVAGYDQELKELNRAVKNENDPSKRSELEERHRRVQEYRAQHNRRLNALRGNDFPADQIRRGLDRHIEPESWM